jgi:hypothetical protein
LLLTEAYTLNEKKMGVSLRFFESFWKVNDERYFNVLEKAIGEKIEKYNVLLSHFVAGTSDWEANNICVNAYSNEIPGNDIHVYLLLFEVILSHFFKKIRKKRKDLGDSQIWATTELISFIILHSEFDLFESVHKTDYKEVDINIDKAISIYQKVASIGEFVKWVLKVYEGQKIEC